ncbi:hypothetical protein KIH79_07355 [Bifidobacterium sp. 82T10]|uniref:Abi-like protein n=1 Tax=Bifidobacterium miconis TaxID=2834435 RepID=A0ABS6WFW2_9BIFI|nr:hypothetical protein [Bifidobacterium miconis]MBW3092730.1 hypothetical protein [Bifidobacterium miconis]MBW3092757.1 hypothetical protein [Bifidobacterium miconis]
MDNAEHETTQRTVEEEVCRLLGTARLAAFQPKDQDAAKTLEAYRWQLRLEQALLKPISITEVLLRNALDESIRQWWQHQGLPGDWLDDNPDQDVPEPLCSFLRAKSWRGRAATNLKAHKSREQINHDDVIAHMMLGTWRNMIGNPASISRTPPTDSEKRQSWNSMREADEHCAALWAEILHNAFPNMPSKRQRNGMSSRGYIGSKLTVMASLRNRVCHWDSLIRVNVQARYEDMMNITRSISTSGAQWMQDNTDEELSNVLEARPDWL